MHILESKRNHFMFLQFAVVICLLFSLKRYSAGFRTYPHIAKCRQFNCMYPWRLQITTPSLFVSTSFDAVGGGKGSNSTDEKSDGMQQSQGNPLGRLNSTTTNSKNAVQVVLEKSLSPSPSARSTLFDDDKERMDLIEETVVDQSIAKAVRQLIDDGFSESEVTPVEIFNSLCEVRESMI